MGQNIVQKIISSHLVSGGMIPGEEIAVKIDQTLTQDATGTMAYLQFEAMGIPKVKTELSVSYVDHNTLQTGFENADDHKFLQTIAAKYGIYFSKPGNGICHQVHLERFGIPGKTLLGSDSHTPTGGGIGMLAIGAGGLDVAVAMGGAPFHLNMPKVVLVRLKGRLKSWVCAKDIILELLKRLTVKGGVGKVFEYGGESVKTLSVPERATITNMGAELGATTSIFPGDEMTRAFMAAESRAKYWRRLEADKDAQYDEIIDINLSNLVPLVAQPHSPDKVVEVKAIEGMKVDQVTIGSCTNSSYKDMMTVAGILKGRRIHPDVSLVISPGSKQVLSMISKSGALSDMLAAGARILETACGPCIGMGQAPASAAVSIRTYNRNFEGRSGTPDAKVYLLSPETAAVSAIEGVVTDPRKAGKAIRIVWPKKFKIDDGMILPPSKHPEKVEIKRGPNIKSLPRKKPLADNMSGAVIIKVGDNITTDHIMPAGAKILPLRSNIPAIAEHVFEMVDPEFAQRAKKHNGGFIVGGANYGQGSSREHAALAPMYLGIKAVIAKSFSRIHYANLVNFGIIPLIFADEADYKRLSQDDTIEIKKIKMQLRKGNTINATAGGSRELILRHSLTPRQVEIIVAGGLLNYVVKNNDNNV